MALQETRHLIPWPPLGMTSPNLFTHTTIDAAGEYFGWAILAQEDMAISHVYLKLQAATGSPTADLRLETIDPATGLPTGTLWDTNTNIVTGTLTTTGTVHALTATANVSKGQWVFVKVLYNSGTSFQVNNGGAGSQEVYNPHYVVTNTGTPAKGGLNVGALGLGSSATSMYYLGGNVWPISANSSSGNINNSNGARSGIRFQVPFACEIIGARIGGVNAANFDLTAYDDAGSAISGVTGSHVGAITSAAIVFFGTPLTPTINTWYRIAVVPTTGSNVLVPSWTALDSDMMSGCAGRNFFRRTDYTTAGGWSETNANQIPLISLITRRLDDGASVGGDASPRIIVG
jgi:hypothetical protein